MPNKVTYGGNGNLHWCQNDTPSWLSQALFSVISFLISASLSSSFLCQEISNTSPSVCLLFRKGLWVTKEDSKRRSGFPLGKRGCPRWFGIPWISIGQVHFYFFFYFEEDLFVTYIFNSSQSYNT